MMTWNLYRLRFRLLSPIHIGRSKVGNLQHTYPYVHGRALWGAFTARLTRHLADGSAPTPNDYQAMGQRVHQELAFSYFYPATLSENGLENIWLPDGNDLSYRYISSYSSTALNYLQNAAEEASLHEIEFLTHHACDNGAPVFLIGYLGARSGSDLPWQDVLDDLQLGAEHSYGWGRVKLEELTPAPSDVFGYQVITEADKIQLIVPKDNILLAHADSDISACGRAAPFVGRMWRNQPKQAHLMGAGQEINYQGVFWEPGSQALAQTRLVIGNFGIWHRI